MCVICGENMREMDDGLTTDRPSFRYGKNSHTGMEQISTVDTITVAVLDHERVHHILMHASNIFIVCLLVTILISTTGLDDVCES